MNKYQKMARFTLIILGLALGLSVTAVLILRFAVGMSWHTSMAGFAFIGIMGFSRIRPSFFKKDKQGLDERDLLIKQKAMVAAYWSFWPLFVLAAMAPFFVYGPDGMVSVNYLCGMVFGGMYWVFLIYSIAILNEYGWKSKGGTENE
ncbi:MAG: hypothetical protein FVQ80_01865 [Planctomycetes bacterium]|nr:hypothetical protein [Planctomycetota bacterium]